MKSKFALSFGITLIVIGCINLFINTNNTILFGISLSAFIFSLINILFATIIHDEKYELLYIFPLLIMLCFFCYGNEIMKFDIIKTIINSKLTSALTFISFGLSFLSEYITNGNLIIIEQIRYLTLSNNMLKYNILLLDEMTKYEKELTKEKIKKDDVSKRFTYRLKKLLDEQNKKLSIRDKLLENEDGKYSIEDFDRAYDETSEVLSIKPITNKNNEKTK